MAVVRTPEQISSRGTVLVVDDSPLVNFVVRRELSALGWCVHTSTDASPALEHLQSESFDVVVCDLHLPDHSGLDMIDQIKQLDPSLPVVMLTGDDDLESALAAIRRGAFDYVLKAEDWTLLCEAVDRASEHRRIKRENLRLSQLAAQQLQELTVEVQERRAAEEALRLARDEALAASRAKSTFLATMSHELRTPLNAILGYAELLLEDLAPTDEVVERDLAHICNAGHHLLALINDVLDLAKLEAGRSRLKPARCDLRALVLHMVETCRPMARERGNTLELHCPSDLDSVITDRLKLSQCLLNLIGNAVKFTADGAIHVRLDVVCRDGQRWISLEVSDEGIGMSDDDCRRVFDDFVQADQSPTRRFGGSGLGLAITSRIVDLLGGSVSVRSELGQGTTFTLTLPELMGRHAEVAP